MASPQGTSGVWVVVPVYNNAATVRRIALACRTHVARVVVVDDGSTDADLAGMFANTDITVLRHAVNRGKGAALLTALDHVAQQGGEFLVTLDADGQHDPADLPAFLRGLRRDAVLIGAREYAARNRSGWSRFGVKFSNFWFRIETGLTVADTQSGFRGYPVWALKALRFGTRAYDWEIEVLVRSAWAGLSIVTTPIRVHYPPRAERITHFRPWLDNWRLTCLHTRLVGRALLPFPHRRLSRGEAARGSRRTFSGTALGIWFFAQALAVFGLWGAYRLLDLVALHYLIFARGARSKALAYLRHRFPDAGGWRRALQVYRLFHAQGRHLIDTYAAAVGAVEFDLRIADRTVIDRLGAAGEGCVLLMSHVGNWKISMPAFAQVPKSIYLVKRPDEDRAMAESLGLDREDAQVRLISPDGDLGGAIEIVRAIDQGAMVAMMGDRRYGADAVRVPSFLGAPAWFPFGAFHIAATCRVPVAVFLCAQTGPRQYTVNISRLMHPFFQPGRPKKEQLAEWVRDYAEGLEEFVLKYPYQCFIFDDVWKD